jgi:hypothetical protein
MPVIGIKFWDLRNRPRSIRLLVKHSDPLVTLMAYMRRSLFETYSGISTYVGADPTGSSFYGFKSIR